jgi:hypothetical protein
VKIIGRLSGACKSKRTSTEKQKNFNWRSWHEEDACKNGPKGHAHTALCVREFLASKQITVLEFTRWMTSGVIWWQLWRPFHKTSSKTVLKGGLAAGIGA